MFLGTSLILGFIPKCHTQHVKTDYYEKSLDLTYSIQILTNTVDTFKTTQCVFWNETKISWAPSSRIFSYNIYILIHFIIFNFNIASLSRGVEDFSRLLHVYKRLCQAGCPVPP